MRDSISVTRAALLHPKFQPLATSMIIDAETALGITLRIVQGLRTFKEQAAIYAQGRTTPGKIVTYSPPGASYHNYGLAIDIVPVILGVVDWNYDYNKLRPFAVKYNMTMGMDFTHRDADHFENKFGFNWRTLLHKYDAKDFIPGTEFVNI